MDDAEKIKYFERKLRNSKKGSRTYMEALTELRNIPGSGYEVPANMDEQPRENNPADVEPEKSSTMANGGMARGKGNKMQQHNYATGGSVTDNLKKVPEDNAGLNKLPKDVRNKMGYMKRGGMSTKR